MNPERDGPLSDKALQQELIWLRSAVKKLEAEKNELLSELSRMRAWGTQSATVPKFSPNETASMFLPTSEASPRFPTMPLIPPKRPVTQPYLPAAYQDQPPTGGPVAEDKASFDVSSLKTLRADQLDALPYGLVVLDREGSVLQYNDTESRMARLPKDQVIGRNFFRDIAPCTRVKEFEGRFLHFASGASRATVETFDFVFRFGHGVQEVAIYVTQGRARGTFNLAMLRKNVR